MPAPARSAPLASASATSVTATYSEGTALGPTYGHIALVRRQGSADTAMTTPSGWTLVSSGVSGTSSRVALYVYARRGDGTTNSITVTGTNSMTTQVWLFAWGNIKENTFWTAAATDVANGNRTTMSALTTTAAEDDSTAVAFCVLGGTAGGSGIAWSNSFSTITGGSSSSSNSWARRDVPAGDISTSPTWTTSGLAAATLFSVKTQLQNVAPTVTLSANQNVSAAATVNLTATAEDIDGTIASYAWTFDYPTSGAPTLTGGSTATPSFTAGSAGALYVLRCTVTDNTGATGTATTEVRVPVGGGTAARNLPVAGTTVGTWTNVGGASSNGAALADESDTTYLESGETSSTEQSIRIRVQPSGTRASATVACRLGTDAGTATAKVRLYEGNTLRQEWTQAVTTTTTNYTFTVTTPGNVTDWGNLFLEIAAVS